jgi:hypothetical protein
MIEGPIVLPPPPLRSPLFHAQEVHHQESNVTPAPKSECPRDVNHGAIAEDWRHRGWHARRQMVRQALGKRGSKSRTDAFSVCGTWCVVERSPSEKRVRIRGNYCHDRFCEPCGRARSNRIAKNLEKQMSEKGLQGKHFRLITLTLKHSRAPLSKQVDRLYKSFRALRACGCWKRSQDGGAAFLEIKRSATGEWHPHLHVVMEGGFLDQQTLRDEWHRITKDSFIADIRMVRDLSQAAAYVAKYAAKPMDPSIFFDAEALAESIGALSGRRLCTTLGTWRGFELEAKPPDPKDWELVWKLSEFLLLLRAQDPTAVRFATDNRICFHELDETQDLYMSSA